MSDGRDIITLVAQRQDCEQFRRKNWVGTFAEYLDIVRERPEGFRLISEGERHPTAAAVIARASDEIVERITALVVRISGRRRATGARLVAVMITGMLTSCAREAVATGADLDAAAALSYSFLYSALRGLDADLIT